MKKHIETGREIPVSKRSLENQEKKVIDYLIQQGYSQKEIAETCKDESLDLDEGLVAMALQDKVPKKRILETQIIRNRPAKSVPRASILDYQKISKRSKVKNFLVPLMFAGSIVFGVPVGRFIANDVKENMFTREYKEKLLKYGDYNRDGFVDDREKSAFYRQVFPEYPKSVDEMLQKTRAYQPNQ